MDTSGTAEELEQKIVNRIDEIGNELEGLAHSYFLIYTMGPDEDIGWCLKGEYYHLTGILAEAMRQHTSRSGEAKEQA